MDKKEAGREKAGEAEERSNGNHIAGESIRKGIGKWGECDKSGRIKRRRRPTRRDVKGDAEATGKLGRKKRERGGKWKSCELGVIREWEGVKDDNKGKKREMKE